METTIKKIEDMSLNAWPSHKMELYDGWILRFSYFYTHRTNSVEQFGTSTLPWREKIPYCEQVDGLWMLNPGSCGGRGATYGVISLENGEVMCYTVGIAPER